MNACLRGKQDPQVEPRTHFQLHTSHAGWVSEVAIQRREASVSESASSRRRWACAGLMSVLLRGHTRHRQNHRQLGTDSKAELAMSCQDMPTSEETHARGQG